MEKIINIMENIKNFEEFNSLNEELTIDFLKKYAKKAGKKGRDLQQKNFQDRINDIERADREKKRENTVERNARIFSSDDFINVKEVFGNTGRLYLEPIKINNYGLTFLYKGANDYLDHVSYSKSDGKLYGSNETIHKINKKDLDKFVSILKDNGFNRINIDALTK